MHFHQNHCWCSRSNWDSNTYDSQYMVAVRPHINYQHLGDYVEDSVDWDNIVTEIEFFNEKEYTRLKEYSKKLPTNGMTNEMLRSMSMQTIPTLNPKVDKWLSEHVLDTKTSKGWAVGDDEYRATGSRTSLTIWFQRRRDALNFIKEWSVYKKPTTYLNYFKDDYRELHEGKLKKFNRSTQEFNK